MVSYTLLREIQKKESESAAIAPLEEHFYHKTFDFLKKKKEEVLASNSILAIKEYENIKKIILNIQAKREEKIVLMALRGELTGDGLVKEEKVLLGELSESIKRSRNDLKSVMSSAEQPTSKDLRKVKILKDIERYKGIDNLVYGPFKSGEESLLPKDEADWLLKSKIAELA